MMMRINGRLISCLKHYLRSYEQKTGKGSKLIRVPTLLVDQVDTLIKKHRENEMDFDINEYIKKRIEQLEQDKKGQTLEVKATINNALVELKTLQEKIGK